MLRAACSRCSVSTLGSATTWSILPALKRRSIQIPSWRVCLASISRVELLLFWPLCLSSTALTCSCTAASTISKCLHNLPAMLTAYLLQRERWVQLVPLPVPGMQSRVQRAPFCQLLHDADVWGQQVGAQKLHDARVLQLTQHLRASSAVDNRRKS